MHERSLFPFTNTEETRMKPAPLERARAANPAHAIVHPLERHTIDTALQYGDVLCTIALYGRDMHADVDRTWSLSPFSEPSDQEKLTAYYRLRPELASRLIHVSRQLETLTWNAPSPDFKGKVIPRSALRANYELSHDIGLWRGTAADGIELAYGDGGYLLSAAGCAVILATDGMRYVAAHAGRESLIDYRDPKRASIVENISRVFEDREAVHVWPFFAIQPKRFPARSEAHRGALALLRKRGDCDHLIGENGSIDMPLLIAKQFSDVGIENVHITKFSYLPDGAYDTRSDAPFDTYRNLIAVAIK